MKISYTALWAEIMALLARNKAIIAAVALALIFVPATLAALFNVEVPEPGGTPSLAEYGDYLVRSLNANWLGVLLNSLAGALAVLVIMLVLLDGRRPTVGEAFGMALPLFLFFLLLNWFLNLILFAGLLVFVLPGLYLLGRLSVAAAALVAEGKRNPFDAIARSLALTKGAGWRIALFILLIFLVLFVMQLAINGTLGAFLQLLRGGDAMGLPALLLAMIKGAFATVTTVLTTLIGVALYRQLATGRTSGT